MQPHSVYEYEIEYRDSCEQDRHKHQQSLQGQHDS
jgi:hypothetical protein